MRLTGCEAPRRQHPQRFARARYAAIPASYLEAWHNSNIGSRHCTEQILTPAQAAQESQKIRSWSDPRSRPCQRVRLRNATPTPKQSGDTRLT